MIAAVVALAAAVLVLLVLGARDRATAAAERAELVSKLAAVTISSAEERAGLIRAVIARHAGEHVALEAAAKREPKERRQRGDEDPPPGTQPIGLSGGFG